VKATILFIILALVWVMVVANRNSKRKIAGNDAKIDRIQNRKTAGWGKEDCNCGTPRGKWKALAMNRPDHTVLLYCPQCQNLWEEIMSMYGSKWRSVDEVYAKENYDYSADF
jgi:hypothetical protein